MITLDEMNRCLGLFAESQKAFMRSEKRAQLRSVLFDVPRRSSLGWHCIYEAAVPLLKEVAAVVLPEEIGRRMKRLCSRPYYLQLSILMCSYFGARQQLILDHRLAKGEPLPSETAEKIQEARWLVDFWKRVVTSYRNDGALLPAEAAYTQPILDEDAAREVASCLRASTPRLRQAVRRLAASLELYAFILHGEQRDGIFAHGPYPQPDGTGVVVHEFTDLQNDYLPWAATEARIPYSNIAVVLRLKDVRTRFDLFGSVLFEPPELTANVMAEALLTRSGDEIRSIGEEEIESIQRAAADAQNELYLRAAEWPVRYKVEYGTWLFANHVREFFRVADMETSWEKTISQRFHKVAEPFLEAMLADPEPPSMWRFMAETSEDFFCPVIPPKPEKGTMAGTQ